MWPLSTTDLMVGGMTPDYEKGYKEGFNDARRAYEKRLKNLLKEMGDKKPLEDATTTSTSPQDIISK